MKKKFTNRFLILVLSAIFILSGFQAEAQNGYIYIHQKCLDELSSVDFPFTGTGSIGSFSLNDNPTQIASIDLGCSQSGRLWAVSASNVLYYRAVNSTSWVQTSITNALHVAGGPNDTCYVVTTGNSVEIFNGTTATTIATSPSASLGNSGAINISSGWNRSPYVINGNGNLYRYSGTGTTWAQASTGTFQGILDANPVNGNAVVLGGGPNYNVYIVTPAGLLTAIGSPTLNSNTISDIAVDASGNIYTVTGSYVSKYNGGSTWGATDPTSRGSSYMTAGVGNEAWCGGIGGTTSPYGNFFARAVDSLGNTYWIDDERVRTSPTNQNSVLLAVAPGTYTIQQAVPAGWYLQQILIYDSLNHSTANFSTASVRITVTAGHTVDVIYQTGLLQTFQMTTSCAVSYSDDFGTGSVGSFGPSLTGQTPYHFLNSAVNCNDGYYKVVTSAYDWANFGLGSTNEPNFYDHTTGNGTGQMMAVNASYDKNEFFRRRFEGLVTGARYKFSAWIASFDNVDIQPNVEFEVLDTGTQAIIASSSSGTIAPAGTWVQNSLIFTATAPSFDLVLRNNNIGGNGNDLGLDDINFALSPVIAPVTTIVSTGCNTLGSITVTSPVGSTYEYSLNGGAFQTSTYFPNLPAGIYTITANFIGTSGCSTFQTDTVRAAICGNVFHDNNGLTDGTVNGTGTNAGGVNVVIYDYTIHQAVATAVVQNDGTYQIGGIYTVGGAPGDSLSLYLTTASVTVGQSAIPALTLPTGWIYTGEFLGTGPGSSGTNGILPLGKVTTNLTNANFGINCSAIAGSPQTICQNGSVTTSASSTGTGTWSIRSGNPASTSITSTNSPTTTITGFTVPGIYYFYWSNGCTEDSLEVTVNPVPGTGITGPNVSIAAGSSTTLSATGGSSFLWSPSATLSSSTASSPIATPTATTTYSVTVTNAFSCSSTGTQTVTVVSLPNVSAGDDTFVCVGSGIKLNGSSTTPGATFQWFSTAVNYLNSSTIATPTATPTVAGNYQYILRVTYFSGGIFVSNYDTMYLTAYPVPVITATPSSVSVCNGTPVNISFSSTVSATYTWLASNGTSGIGNISANISNNGTHDSTIIYHVVGTSAGGCKDTISVTAVVHPVPVLSATGFSKSICGGSNYTGTVTSSVPGAAITWTSTAGLNGSGGSISVPINNSGTTPDTVVFSFTGTYSGCASSVLKDTVIVYPTVTASAGTSQSFCQPVSGTVTLGGNPTATGGSGNYSYAWTPTTDLVGSTLANPTVVSTIATNTEFHLTVTDNVTGCIFTDSTHLTINSKAVVTISGSDDSLCIGNSAVLQATGTPSGGTYQWAPLVSLAPLAGNTPTVTVTPSNVGTQSYQVVYSVSGCHDTAYQAVSAYPAVSAHADSGSNQALTYCFPVSGTVRLGAAATATGGSGGFTYAWSPATNLSSPSASNPIVTISGATTVTYHLTVTDTVTHCTASDSVVLTVNPAPTISIAGLSDTNLCLGSSTVLSATTVSPAGGTYKWSPQLGMTPSNGSSDTVTVSPGASQTYTLVYTSAANCSASASVNVHIYPVVTAHGGGPKNYCPPINSVSLGANPAATGGSGHYTYSWTSSSGSTATLSNPNSPTPTATPTGTTTYYLTVTDSLTGCTSVDSVVVTRNPTPLAQTNASSSICFGGSATLTASGGVTFIWSNAGSLSNANACCPIATPSTTTTYTVTVTDVNGCTASASTTITVGSVLRFTIDSASICQGDTGILTPSLIGPNYRYTWTLEPGISCVSCATPSVYPTSSSIYGLTILDTVNGCSSGTDTAVVTVHANPVAGFVTTEACQGQVTQFTDVSTSADPINQWFYNFGDGTLTNDTSRLKNPIYTYQTTTSHIAYETVTTIYGCSSTAHNSVPSYPPVVPYVTPDTCISIGSSITLNATGGNLFAWTPAGTLSNPNISNPVASPLVTTTYKVVVTSANGCTATDSVKITVDTLPNVSAGHDTFVCVGGSVPLRGSSSSPGATYHWTSSVAGILNNPNIAQPIATPTASGTYTFILTATVHDPICNINVSNNDTMILTVDPLPVITATPADTLVACGGSPIIYAFGSNVSGTTYKWRGSNGTSGIGSISTSVNNTTTHDSSVVYTVVGTTPGGCTDTILVHAVIHPVQTLTATGFSSSLCAGAYFTGTVTSNISGSTITWSTNIGLNGTGGNINVQLNNFGTVADTVIFSFTGSKNGCSSAVLYDTVIVNPQLHADAGTNTTIISCSSDSIQLGGFPSAYGGYPGYKYHWSPLNGFTNDSLANPYIKNIGNLNTTYVLIVTDQKGCTAVDSMKVTVQPPTIAVSISASGSTTWCQGTNGTVDLTANVTGGAPLYSFSWTSSASNPGLTNASSQVATVAPTAPGAYVYNVEVTDSKGCQAQTTETITVKPEPHNFNVTGLNAVYCASVASVPLTVTPSGGTWSGPGVVGSTFRPSLIGQGTYTLIYTLTSGGCTNDTSITVTVDSVPVISISGNTSTYCSLDPAATFIGTPAGGTWSGSGINASTGVFNPDSVSIPNNISRTVTITYQYTTSPAGCTASSSVSLTVNKSATVTIGVSADTVCQNQTVILTPHYTSPPQVSNIEWYDVNGTSITNSLNPITVNPTGVVNHGYYAVISTTAGCYFNDTVSIHVNQSPHAAPDKDSTCEGNTIIANVLANDTDPEGNSEVLSSLGAEHGTAVVVTNEIQYTPAYGYHGLDTVKYRICNSQCQNDCDTSFLAISICAQNLPPIADTINYTQLDSVPQDLNVILATGSPNSTPLTISLIGDSTHNDSLTILHTGNGAYTITGNDTGTYVITYQVCDSSQYVVHVLCDTSVIIAHIIPPADTAGQHPPILNNDFATTSGTAPAVVNVRGNDFTDPQSHGLTIPTLLGNTTPADGTWTVNANGQVVFTPKPGLAPGIYYDTIQYRACDSVNHLCGTAYVYVITDEIDTASIANRPPVAVNDHETVGENTTTSFNVKANDSDPDGNPLTIPTIVTGPVNGTIVSIADNGTVTYKPNPNVVSINGQPVDSFKYQICDSQSVHPVSPLCSTAEVYIYVNQRNLPPTADTINYTQLDSVPQDINVILATGSPNSTPLTISLIGDSTHHDSLTILHTGNGAYTITGNDTGTYVITYQVCDSSQYVVHVLCDTSVIIAHIIPPADTLSPHPPIANNDFATTSGTAPAVVNVRGNDYSDPTSHGLTVPTLLGNSNSTADGTWSVNANGQVVFTPNAGLAPGIYHDTIYYQVCDLVDVPQLCATAYVAVTTDEIDTALIANRPPVAVNDHETVGENTTTSFNVKANDSDPDGNPLTIPTIVTGPVNGTIVSIADNGTVTYKPNPNVLSINGQPVDSFKYQICDSQAVHPVSPLCSTAEVYIYVNQRNLPPIADTINYTQLDSVPQDLNVILATGSPNSTPLTISLIGDSTHNDSLTILHTGNGAYTITGNDTGTYVITYQVCDSSQYVVHVLCDTSVIIAHIIPPADTAGQHPPILNNDFATTSGTAPAVVNVRGNDFTDPQSHGLTIPTLLGNTTPADGTWTVNANGQVVFTPKPGLAPGIYYDTIQYRACDSVNHLCGTAYVYVITDEIDTASIANRPPVAVNDHETVGENTTTSFNVKANDSDPDGNPLTIPTIVTGPVNGTIVSIADNGTVTYKPNPNVVSINGQPVDSFKYQICDSQSVHPVSPLCSTAEVYIYVNQRNLPPTADTINYTQLDSVPQDINVILATGSPNSTPLTISLIGDSTHHDSLTILHTGNGAYTITGNDTGTYVITYQVCDSSQYVVHVLCDTSVIIAHIIPPADTLSPHPPIANNDFATTSGTAPAVVNVRGNDYSDPTSHGLTVPTLLGNSNSTADGTWSVNANGQVVFTPNAGLAPGIYHDTIYYQVCDLVDVPQLCATAYVAVTTDEIDTALIANRPPVAVNDHETVPETIPTSFNVKANDSDPDGNPLTIPTILVGPLHGTILSVGDNGTVIYQSDTNIHSSNSHTPVDSFEYQICDSQSVHPVSPLCSTAEVYIYVPQLLFAVNDTSLTGCHTPDTICVKDNDYDIEHNPFFVTGVVVQPLNGTAVLNPVTQCIVYTPNGSASNYTDSFRYAIKEPLYGATDSAWVFVHVVCCQIDAANDTFSLPYEDSIYAAVLANDIYNNSLPQTVTILAGSGPSNGIATVVGDSVKYVANRGFCGTDVFKYILSDLCGKDTAEVVINVICPNCNKPLATNDTISNGYVCIATIKVLAKDTFTAGASVTLVKPPLYGTDTVINNNIVYTPDGTHPNTVDTLTYSLCNPCGRCDTATVFIDLSGYPCNVGNPKLVNDTVTICRNKDTLVNVLLGAHDPGGFVITISAYTQGSHGSVSQRGDSLLYKPTTNYVGSDTFTYQACDSGTPSLCSTAFVYVNILPCAPPVIVIPDTIIRDTTVVCVAKQFCIDSIYQALGDSLTYIGLCGAPSNGTLTLLGSDTVSAQYGTLCFTYTPTCDTTVGNTPFTGNDTMCVIICSTGPVADTACITRQIVITILPKPPVDSIRANPDLSYICGSADTIYVLSNDAFGPQPGNNELGTAITVHAIGQSAGEAPLHGTVTFGPGDTTVIYTPDSAYVGIDSFKYVITKNGIVQIYDTATVTVYVCVPATPIAVNDNPSCLDTTGYVDQPAIINILGNDTLSRANDTLVVIVDSVLHGHLVINADYTVTYTPDSGFHGNDNFSYQVYEFIGSSIGKSDTATVCIDIIDTTGLCFFPNGFSPNGDGVNDYFVFPCNDKYPNASLQIFNRWVMQYGKVRGGYKNDWDGRNLKGNPVPDGTYYFIYAYNDGSGRTSARFVVVNR